MISAGNLVLWNWKATILPGLFQWWDCHLNPAKLVPLPPVERLHNLYSDHLALFVPAFPWFRLGREMLAVAASLAVLPLSGDHGGQSTGVFTNLGSFSPSGEYPYLGKTPSLF